MSKEIIQQNLKQSFYLLCCNDVETKTLYEIFLVESYNSHLSEIIFINKRLQVIGTKRVLDMNFLNLEKSQHIIEIQYITKSVLVPVNVNSNNTCFCNDVLVSKT
ncbi:MAG: hypothetical protein Q8T08_22910, partial [Ignavibacteria bacterium]|nr:hypothetical protein [Ignavibacteria bacterium]